MGNLGYISYTLEMMGFFSHPTWSFYFYFLNYKIRSVIPEVKGQHSGEGEGTGTPFVGIHCVTQN